MIKSKKILKLLIATTALGISVPSLADVKTGVDAWGRGDYQTAISEWRGPAANGDADAQFNMAQAYKLGRGVTMDLSQAETWYKKAADQGHLQASDNYGLILFQNNRRAEALPYLQSSSSRGEPRAQYVLGTGHFNGDFVEKDWIKAYALMTRASAKGLPQATSNIGQMDKYIPISDRRRAVELASQMEQDEKRVRTAQVGGLRPAQRTGPIQTAQIPPSRAATPQLTPAPNSVPGASYASAAEPQSTAPISAMPLNPRPVRAATDGKWRVQLGAFSDQKKAKNLWRNLEGRVSGLRDLQPYLVYANGITRLQAGPFSSRSQAVNMCSKVKTSGNACIVKTK